MIGAPVITDINLQTPTTTTLPATPVAQHMIPPVAEQMQAIRATQGVVRGETSANEKRRFGSEPASTTRGAEQAGDEEVALNPRARSVRLRAAERVRPGPLPAAT